MDITPAQVLTDFMNNLSCSNRKREGRDKAKEHLINYFMEHGYGQQLYSTEQIRNLFKKMDAVGLLWPGEQDVELMELYTEWREAYFRTLSNANLS